MARSRCQRMDLPLSFVLIARPGPSTRLDEIVVADGVVAVELEMNEVDDESVSGLRALNVEGTRLGVAAEDAPDALLVGAAGIDGGGVDGVAWVDGEDGLVERRELAVEDGGSKVVALRRGVLERGSEDRGKGVVFRMRGIAGVNLGVIAGEGAVLERGLHGVGAAFVVFGDEVDLVPGNGSFELVAVEVAGEFVALLVEGDAGVDGGAEEFGCNDPVAGELLVFGRLRGGWRARGERRWRRCGSSRRLREVRVFGQREMELLLGYSTQVNGIWFDRFGSKRLTWGWAAAFCCCC